MFVYIFPSQGSYGLVSVILFSFVNYSVTRTKTKYIFMILGRCSFFGLRALYIFCIAPKVSDSPMESVDNSVSGPAYQFTWPILNRHEPVVCKQSNDIDLYFITFPDDVGSSRRNYHWLIFTVITSWYNQIKWFSYLLIFFVFRFSYAQVVTDNLKSLRAIQQAILVRVQTFTA